MKFLSVLLLLSSFFLFQKEEPIVWSRSRQLSWSDFQGVPDPDADAAATTVSGLSYSFSGYIENGKLVYEYDVTALFYPEKSWVHEALKDDELLLHERLHFDITAWYASRLKKAFDTIAPVSDPRSSVLSVYEKVKRELDSVQQLYDCETDYSRDIKGQLLWASRIKAYLDDAYE